MTSLKILAVIAVATLVTGCKFSVIVGEGGKVQSSSGTRNCSEGSTCTFQVSDTTFSDTFTAVPLPGYKFARWQGGTDYQCANSTSPTCVVSNTALAGNAAAATIIASDKVYSIKPVFQVVTAPRYVLKDGNGVVLGDVIRFLNFDAHVRMVHTDENGKQHGYLLNFSIDRVTAGGDRNQMWWGDSNCSGDVVYLSSDTRQNWIEPLFSDSYQLFEDQLDVWPSVFHLARLSQPEEPRLVHVYEKRSGVCSRIWNEMLWMLPATIVVRDLGSQFTPPFGLYQE